MSQISNIPPDWSEMDDYIEAGGSLADAVLSAVRGQAYIHIAAIHKPCRLAIGLRGLASGFWDEPILCPTCAMFAEPEELLYSLYISKATSKE